MITRGIRNNNPGNIRRGKSRWVGLSILKTDKEFCQFTSMSYGLRALMVLIRNYIKNGYDTPYKIIHRYAPASENNTASYLSFVYGYLPSNAVLRPFSKDFFTLIVAICRYESQYEVNEELLKNLAQYFHLCK